MGKEQADPGHCFPGKREKARDLYQYGFLRVPVKFLTNNKCKSNFQRKLATNQSLPIFSFWTGVSSKQEVNQSPEVLTVKEGDSLFLNCSYTESNIYSLQWYRQDPGRGLTFLLIQSSPGEQETGRIKAFFDKTSRHSALRIASAQLSDSATYLCAVRHSA